MSGINYLKNQASPLVDANIQLLQRRQWTRDILRIMVMVIGVAALVISGGILAGIFTFQTAYPIYIVLGWILIAWWMDLRGWWRLASLLAIGLCFLLGMYSSYISEVDGSFILFYAMSILLASILRGTRMSWFVAAIDMVAMTVFAVWPNRSVPEDILPQLVTIFFCLVGITLLMAYFDARVWRLVAGQHLTNQRLVEEMEGRRQAETTQRDQESQLRRLAENTTDLIAEIDPIGTYIFVSPSYWSGLGYSPETLLGSNSYDLVHPDDLPLAQAIAQKAVLDHNPARFQVRCQHADGHYIPFEISGRALFDQNNLIAGFVLASRDITAQQQAELALQESEEKFRRIIEAIPFGMHMYTLNERDELIFTGFNPAAESILHTEMASFLGKTIAEAFPGLAVTDILENYRTVAYLGGRWQKKEVFYQDGSINGAYEVTAFQTAPRKMVAIFVEITEQLKAAESLRLSEEKFSTAFKISPDAVNINRLADGMYLDMNDSFARIMEYRREEVVGKSSLELNIWADPADRARLVKGLIENGVVENLEAQFRRKNGSLLDGLMSARVIEINHEKCILSITRDITERQQAEHELRLAHAELEQAYEATLQGWAQALELREKETAAHSRRVVDLTVRMASALGIAEEELLHIRRGALLHDIGKMGVPDEILLKKGPLSSEEWPIMRRHPEWARDLLKDIEYLRAVMDIPYAHHEHWDGSGYPRGLRGADIPQAARIFTVVDVYDALNSERPYRPAWSEADALHYLVEQKGKLFDPDMVDLFLKIIQDNR